MTKTLGVEFDVLCIAPSLKKMGQTKKNQFLHKKCMSHACPLSVKKSIIQCIMVRIYTWIEYYEFLLKEDNNIVVTLTYF